MENHYFTKDKDNAYVLQTTLLTGGNSFEEAIKEAESIGGQLFRKRPWADYTGLNDIVRHLQILWRNTDKPLFLPQK